MLVIWHAFSTVVDSNNLIPTCLSMGYSLPSVQTCFHSEQAELHYHKICDLECRTQTDLDLIFPPAWVEQLQDSPLVLPFTVWSVSLARLWLGSVMIFDNVLLMWVTLWPGWCMVAAAKGFLVVASFFEDILLLSIFLYRFSIFTSDEATSSVYRGAIQCMRTVNLKCCMRNKISQILPLLGQILCHV